MDGVAASALILKGEAAAVTARAGGKAASLTKLAGVWPIPDFFVISPAAFEDAGLRHAARDVLSGALAALGPGPFAVRSSGIEEDGAAAAHAGQFDSELNVPRDEVEAAAWRIWRSGFSERLAAYRREKGLSDAPQPPAVIVQKMVRARGAGVAFSACPVSGDRSVVVVSAVAGLADRLVSGEVDGDTYRLGVGAELLETQLAGDAPVLSAGDLGAVAALARKAEAHFGAPQDIEWAFEGDTLFLLQSRPITTLPTGAVADGAFTIWDNSNIVESYAGVTSPLTFSFARYVYAHVYRAFSALMGVSREAVAGHSTVFENMLGRIDGRVYYNLLNWYRALALFPGFQSNRGFMEQMMGVAEALPADLAESIAPRQTSAWLRFNDRLRLARTGFGLLSHAMRIKGTMARFNARLDEALSRPNSVIDTLPASELAAEYRSLERKLLSRWDAPLINDFLCMIAFSASRNLLQRWGGPEALAVHADIMIGQGDIISAEPAQRIRAMGALVRGNDALVARLAGADRSAVAAVPALSRALDEYIARFGDRCTQELKLESVTIEDDPGPILRSVAAAARAGESKRGHDAEASITPALIANPVKRFIARRFVAWAKHRVRDRENLRFERTRLFGRVRRIFRGIGKQFVAAGVLQDTSDVFYLTVDELLGAVEGGGVSADLRGLVALRRKEDAASLARPDPPERFSVRGAHAVGVSKLAAQKTEVDLSGEKRTGLACCAGIVTARVRVVADPQREALSPGEILVARHTDPGWIAVFANAAGVIAERGSLLSHSAIVAREMGIPCVVALKGATEWLQTGDLVRLDGAAGSVEKVGAA